MAGYGGRFDGELAQRDARDRLFAELATRYGLDVRFVAELLPEAERAASEDPSGRSAIDWFERLAGIGSRPPVPGRRSLVDLAYGSSAGSGTGRRGNVAPGTRTRTMALAAAMARRDQPRTGTQPLASDLRARMSGLFGFDFSRVQVQADSPEATGPTRAVARDTVIHFREGAYQPGTGEGDRLIAHELAHLVQQSGKPGPGGSRRALEREADTAAALVARGKAARVQLRAPVGAYAYNETEDHDVEPDELARGSQAEAGDDDRPSTDPDGSSEGSAGSEAHDGEKGASDPDETSADGSAESGATEEIRDIGGEAESIGSEPIEADEAPGGAPAVGGGPAPGPQKEEPSVAGARPEAAFAQLQGVRPDKLVGALPEVRSAATADVGKERARQQASPPTHMSTGASVAPAGRKAANEGTDGPESKSATAPKGAPDSPIKAELPDNVSARQEAEAKATQEQKAAGLIVRDAARSSVDSFRSIQRGTADPDSGTAMTDADAQQMAGSIDRMSADASAISTDAGPPPALEMKAEAKGSADRDRAELERKTSVAEVQARSDSRVPMGEDDIDTTVPAEELRARPQPGQVPAAELPTVAGKASTEEVGVIAQEQSGAEIDAALGQAQTDVTGERARHEQAELQARADADGQIRQLKTQADGETEGARRVARTEVDQARSSWQAEVDRKGTDARVQADKKVAEGMAEVEQEETRGNQEARDHVVEGQTRAEEEKRKGEREAEEAKEKGKEKSSGFFGWLKDKAKALVDGIKKAVSAVIDAARKAVKAVIAAAKKLAMAAIELARKAIVAAIQAIGKALLAITDVLLAAFPELKARFQKAIRGMVDRATQAVNRIADGLKKAVQKALDLLGAVLDKALALLEKGLHFIVDAAGAVIQAAIKAAEMIAAALGVWVKLIKDVASGPVAWIQKLGAAVVDGIKNHLWVALKSAVLTWFQAKVFELLGLGGVILQILLDGGMTTADITQMAIQALIVAIPVILVTILIEKLVSMIVPAAGAVVAIIEGMMAAWGTISRIIAAFGAFVAFLLAVKSGGAGPLFAGLLGAAAVVLLDFVANWVLRKLAGPARKVGAKLKKVAEKFKTRVKGKKGPKKPRKREDDGQPDGKPRSRDQRKEEKDRRNREILAKAQRELPPKIRAALGRGSQTLAFRAKLALWRVQYRLSSLGIVGSGDHARIVAKVNPEATLGEILRLHREELLVHVREVAREARRRASREADAVIASGRQETTASGATVNVYDMPAPMTSHGVAESMSRMPPLQQGRGMNLNIGEGTARMTGGHRGLDTTHIIQEFDQGRLQRRGGKYSDIAIRHRSEGAVMADAIDEFMKTGKAPPGFPPNRAAALIALLHGVEPGKRSMAAGVHAEMLKDLLRSGVTPEEVLGQGREGGLFPMSPGRVVAEAQATDQYLDPANRANRPNRIPAAVDRHMEREIQMVEAWVRTLDLVFSDTATERAKIDEIKRQITVRILGDRPPG